MVEYNRFHEKGKGKRKSVRIPNRALHLQPLSFTANQLLAQKGLNLTTGHSARNICASIHVSEEILHI
jgi:hypothetical protein